MEVKTYAHGFHGRFVVFKYVSWIFGLSAARGAVDLRNAPAGAESVTRCKLTLAGEIKYKVRGVGSIGMEVGV